MRIPGICNHDPTTTVLAHLQAPGQGKMGGKNSDLCGVWACAACHDVIDGRRQSKNWTRTEIKLMAYEGLLRTLAEVSELIEVRRA